VRVFALLELLKKKRDRKELLELTKLSERGLRYRIEKLKKMGLVKEVFDLRDMRRRYYVACLKTDKNG